jgi:membrane-associated phospholipid phosphatase
MPLTCGSLAFAILVHASPAAFAQTAASERTTTAAVTSISSTPHRGTIFTDLIEDTLRDFGRLPSRETATLLSVGAAIAATGYVTDRSISSGMSGARSLDAAFQPGETIGGARLQIIGAAATYAVGKLSGSRRVAQVGADLVRAQIVSQAVTAAIKMSVRRGRPDGTEFSFPSGHSSVTFASATVLQRNFGWKVGVPAYAVATYVAASRIQEKRHFLSDVAFGAAIGIAAGRTVTIGHGGRKFALAPLATPGGGGLSFTWLGQR